jgi:hypothetical protein
MCFDDGKVVRYNQPLLYSWRVYLASYFASGGKSSKGHSGFREALDTPEKHSLQTQMLLPVTGTGPL